jgi:hypothetical protein
MGLKCDLIRIYGNLVGFDGDFIGFDGYGD